MNFHRRDSGEKNKLWQSLSLSSNCFEKSVYLYFLLSYARRLRGSQTEFRSMRITPGHMFSPTITNFSFASLSKTRSYNFCCGDWGRVCVCVVLLTACYCVWFFYCLHQKLCSIHSLAHPFICPAMIPVIDPINQLNIYFWYILCISTVLVTLDRDKACGGQTHGS